MSDSQNSRTSSTFSASSGASMNPFANHPPGFPAQPARRNTAASSDRSSTQNTRVMELQDRNAELQSNLRHAELDAQRVTGNLAVLDHQLRMATSLIATLRDQKRENELELANAKQLLLEKEGSEAKKDKMLLFAKEEAAKLRENQAKTGAVIKSLVQIIVVLSWISIATFLAHLLKK